MKTSQSVIPFSCVHWCQFVCPLAGSIHSYHRYLDVDPHPPSTTATHNKQTQTRANRGSDKLATRGWSCVASLARGPPSAFSSLSSAFSFYQVVDYQYVSMQRSNGTGSIVSATAFICCPFLDMRVCVCSPALWVVCLIIHTLRLYLFDL